MRVGHAGEGNLGRLTSLGDFGLEVLKTPSLKGLVHVCMYVCMYGHHI